MNRDPRALSAFERKIYDDIAACGLHIIFVSETEETAGWAFSIGLNQTFDHPEILMFGFEQDMMHTILNGLADDIRQGVRYGAGVTSPNVLEGYDCRFDEIQRIWYTPFLGTALWYYDGEPFTCVQCVWPDKSGLFPDDPASDTPWDSLQPVLSQADPKLARVKLWLSSMGLPTETAG